MTFETDIILSGVSPALAANGVLSTVAEDERAAIRAVGRSARLRRGEHLYLAGDADPRVMFIEFGLTRTAVDFSDGSGVLTALTGPEGVLGLSLALSGQASRHTVTALAETGGVIVPATSLRRLVSKRPRLLRNCLRILADQQTALEDEIACSTTHRIEQRLARLLLKARDCLDSDRFEMRQEELAQMLGVQRTTVSMLAHGLKAKGLLAYMRGVVHIVDPAGLAAVSCGCSTTGVSADDTRGSSRCSRTLRAD